jgi:hypothetical protein
MDFSNDTINSFLAKECSHYPELLQKYGEGLAAQETDVAFWESLSEHLDCFRVCDECGKPMIEGYVVDGCETYCSEECLHKHISSDEFTELYNNGEGDTYYTTWYENSMTFRTQQ